MPAMPFPACCEGRARCVPAATVDPMQAENLEEHECGDLTGGPYLCVPDELIRGDTPPACNAESWILGDYNGVCLSDCLDFGFEGIALEQGNCAGGYTCAPCIDPTSGQPTGAPGCPSAP
jgi:hypothetical protein